MCKLTTKELRKLLGDKTGKSLVVQLDRNLTTHKKREVTQYEDKVRSQHKEININVRAWELDEIIDFLETTTIKGNSLWYKNKAELAVILEAHREELEDAHYMD